MKNEISTRADVKFIISTFYEKLLKDDEMLPFFIDIVKKGELEHHLETITDFWEDILFQTYNYKNNPMQKHLDFDKKVTFSKRHFYLWLEYFNQTVDEFFTGQKALDIKTRAQSIATIMQVKMSLYQN